MTHMASISQLIDLANSIGLNGEAEELIELIDTSVNRLADQVSDHFGIQNSVFINESEDFGGLGVGFVPMFDGQTCPEPVAQLDPSSDWASN